MNGKEPSESRNPQAEGAGEKPEKKAYARPEIIYRAPLEAMASSCTGTGKNPGGCMVTYS